MIVMGKHRGSKDTNKMLSAISGLESGGVQVGHFLEQGNHKTSSDFTYVELMRLHAAGLDNNGNTTRPRRDVLAILTQVKNPMLKGVPYTRAFKYFMSGQLTESKAKDTKEMVAKALVKEEKEIFGNPKYLPVTGNPTPLVDTEDLKNNVTYKVLDT